MEKLKFDETKKQLVDNIVSFINKNGHYAEIGYAMSVSAINAVINDRKFLIDVIDQRERDVEYIAELSHCEYMLVNSFDDFIKQLLINLVIKKV